MAGPSDLRVAFIQFNTRGGEPPAEGAAGPLGPEISQDVRAKWPNVCGERKKDERNKNAPPGLRGAWPVVELMNSSWPCRQHLSAWNVVIRAELSVLAFVSLMKLFRMSSSRQPTVGANLRGSRSASSKRRTSSSIAVRSDPCDRCRMQKLNGRKKQRNRTLRRSG